MNPIRVGNKTLIRTVTMYVLGEVVSIDDHFIVLKNAGWVADTGRFSQCLELGKISEYERAPDGAACVGIGAVTDAWNWNHDLPTKTI